jgi:hypothetical protein
MLDAVLLPAVLGTAVLALAVDTMVLINWLRRRQRPPAGAGR